VPARADALPAFDCGEHGASSFLVSNGCCSMKAHIGLFSWRGEVALKFIISLALSMLLLLLCNDVRAQFSQPPPSKAAPVCSERKKGGSDCKNLPIPAEVALSCRYQETGGEMPLRYMSCTATAWRNVGGFRTLIDPLLLKYYWASIVDGQEYYSAPMDEAPSAVVFCGVSGQGYARVTVSGGTAVTAFQCGYPDAGGGG
jgi:hypothetical protein